MGESGVGGDMTAGNAPDFRIFEAEDGVLQSGHAYRGAQQASGSGYPRRPRRVRQNPAPKPVCPFRPRAGRELRRRRALDFGVFVALLQAVDAGG